MNSTLKGYRKTTSHEGCCKKCPLHCLQSSKLQNVSKLEKENVSLKKEKEEWLEEQRRYIVKLGDYSDEKNQFKIKLEKVENEKSYLLSKLKKVYNKKQRVMHDLESKPVVLENYSDKINALKILLEKMEEEKNGLLRKLEIVSEKYDGIKKNLKRKSHAIGCFLYEKMKEIRYPTQQTMDNFFTEFYETRKRIDMNSIDCINIKDTLLKVKEECNNCWKENLNYENQLNLLQTEQVNYKFIMDQQAILIKQLEEKVKSKREKIGSSKKKECTQDNDKLCKEKSDIMLPPTPESWSTSHISPMSCEDISCDKQPSNTISGCLETMTDPLEMKSRSEDQEECLIARNKQNKLHQDDHRCFVKNSMNVTKADTVSNLIDNPVRVKKGRSRKHKRPNVSSNSENNAVDHCNNSNAQESTSNVLGKDSLLLQNKMGKFENVESLEVIHFQKSIIKVPPPQDLSDLSAGVTVHKDHQSASAKESVVYQNRDLDVKDKGCKKYSVALSKELSLGSLSHTTKILPIRPNEENKTNLTDSNFEFLRKSHPVEPVKLAVRSDKNSHLEKVGEKSIINSEGRSSPYDLDSSDFEPILSKLTQFPTVISPFRPSSAEDSRSMDDNECLKNGRNCSRTFDLKRKWINNDRSFSRSPKKRRSIFSPILNCSLPCETKLISKETTRELDATDNEPGEINFGEKLQNNTNCDWANALLLKTQENSQEENNEVSEVKYDEMVNKNEEREKKIMTKYLPDVTISLITKHLDRNHSSCHGKVQGKELPQDITTLNTTLPGDGLSPQSKRVPSKNSLHSPTAMDYHRLGISSKVSKSISNLAISPVISGSHLTEFKESSTNNNLNGKHLSSENQVLKDLIPSLRNKNMKEIKSSSKNKYVKVSLKTTKMQGSPSCYSSKVCHEPHKNKNDDIKTLRILKLTDSMKHKKHNDMKIEIPQRKGNGCSQSSCVKVEAMSGERKSVLGPQTSILPGPPRLKKSKVLPNISVNNADIQVQSSQDDTEPLEMKLKISPHERMNKLKIQKHFNTPVHITIGHDLTNGISVNKNRRKIGLANNFSAAVTKPSCNGNDGEYFGNVKSVNNVRKAKLSRTPKCTYSRKVKSKSKAESSTNDLVKKADVTLNKFSITNVTKVNIPVSAQAEDGFVKSHQETKYDIDATPVHKMETTLSEETLFTKFEWSHKLTGHQDSWKNHSNWKTLSVKDIDEGKIHKKQRLMKKELKKNSSHKRSLVNIERITSLQKLKQTNPKKYLTTGRFRKRSYLNTKKDNKVTSFYSIDARANSCSVSLDKKIDESSNLVKCTSKSCSAIKDSSKLGEMLLNQDCNIEKISLMDTVPEKLKYQSLSTPLSENNSEEDLLVIDIDEDFISFPEANDNSAVKEDESISYATKSTIKTSEKPNPFTKPKKYCQASWKMGVTDSRSFVSGDLRFIKDDIKNPDSLTSPCIVPHFQPLPEAMCRYEENLSKTNTDFSDPKNRILPFSEKSLDFSKSQIIPSSTPVSNNVYLPNFYTEHQDRNEEQQDSNIEHQDPINDSSELSIEDQFCKPFSVNMSHNNDFKLIPLNELIPKGEKIKVTEINVLRTIINKHKEDLAWYKERNILEGRIANKKIPEDLMEKVFKIVYPLLSENLKRVSDIIEAVESLEQYNILVIIKAVIKSLHTIASDTLSGNPKALWVLHWDVQLPIKNSPIVHPKIQEAFLFLDMIINRFTKEKEEQEKRKLVEEELHFIELVFLGSTPEFCDSLPAFWLNLGFLYTLLARQYGQLERVRQLMYDLFYCFTKRALTVAFAMIRIWPDVLPVKPIEAYSNDPYALGIILQLTSVNAEANLHTRSSHLIQPLHNLLWRKYRFRANTVDPDQLFDMCLQRLGQPGVYETLVLLSKKQSRNWFKQRPMQQLMNVIEEWWKGGEECSDVRAVSAIKALCSSLKPYSCTSIQPELTKLFNLFTEILCDENIPDWMQEVIILNTCPLSRLNHKQCLDLIMNWKPKEISREVFDQILVDIIGKRAEKWWTFNQVGRFYLCQS